MKKILTIVVAALLAVTNAQAQHSPVGIVSVQDTTKSVQFGVISSVAVTVCSCLVYRTHRHTTSTVGS